MFKICFGGKIKQYTDTELKDFLSGIRDYGWNSTGNSWAGHHFTYGLNSEDMVWNEIRRIRELIGCDYDHAGAVAEYLYALNNNYMHGVAE